LHEVIRVGVPCSPCFKRRCESTVVEEFGCMKRIEVDTVFDAVAAHVRVDKAGQPVTGGKEGEE
jgi:hypothetical protein